MLASDMEKFRHNRLCKKCGSCNSTVKFMETGSSNGVSKYITGEILRRRCSYCGYEWDELPLDSK